MKAVACAISSASALDQKPPARRLDGAKNTREVRILALKRGLEPLGQRLIGRMVAQEPASHSKHRVGVGPNLTTVSCILQIKGQARV